MSDGQTTVADTADLDAKARAARVDFFNLFAHEKRGTPDGWRWVELECDPDGKKMPADMRRMAGAVYVAAPGKKRPVKVDGSDRTIWFTDAEWDAFLHEWETREGKCHRCYGVGQEAVGHSVANGTRYAACGRCKGTGTPAAALTSTNT